VATLGIPGSAGVPEEFHTIHAGVAVQMTFRRWSNAFQKFKHQIACVIVEPVVGKHGMRSGGGRLSGGAAADYGTGKSVLIFDEVMTGFRVAFRRSAGALQHSS